MKNTLQKPRAKRNPDPVTTFAQLASGVASALQVNEMLKKKKPARRKKRNPVAGKPSAVRKPSAKANPKSQIADRRSKANPKPRVTVPAKGDYYLLTIGSGDDIMAVYLRDGDRDGYSKRFKSLAAAKAYATKNRLKLKANPVKLSAASGRRSAKAKANPTPKAKGQRSKVNPQRPRSRTYEMFQGRKPTGVKRMQVSEHAPARVAQLGDLVEIKLVGQPPIKFNPGRVKLAAAHGKLWIVGKRFARPDASQPATVVNPVGEIDHVVYGTRKPHHGDHAYTHYIHKLGEESGRRPLLCVDRLGFPVIRGGNYKIEARGIVD